jgi:hypothetical protein
MATMTGHVLLCIIVAYSVMFMMPSFCHAQILNPVKLSASTVYEFHSFTSLHNLPIEE